MGCLTGWARKLKNHSEKKVRNQVKLGSRPCCHRNSAVGAAAGLVGSAEALAQVLLPPLWTEGLHSLTSLPSSPEAVSTHWLLPEGNGAERCPASPFCGGGHKGRGSDSGVQESTRFPAHAPF